MSRSKHTEVQIITALKQVEAGRSTEDVAREQGVSKHTIYAWRDSPVVWAGALCGHPVGVFVRLLDAALSGQLVRAWRQGLGCWSTVETRRRRELLASLPPPLP